MRCMRLPGDGTNVRTVRIDNRRGGRAEELKTLNLDSLGTKATPRVK